MTYKLVAPILLVSLCCLATSALSRTMDIDPDNFKIPSLTEIPSFEELEGHMLQPGFGQLHEPNMESIAKSVEVDFDPSCLSNRNCTVVYSVIFWKGIPVLKKVSSENDSPADDFYCAQAIWELPNGLGNTRHPMVCRFTGSPSGKHGQHAELIPDNHRTVKMHIISPQIPDFRALKNDIASPDNVRRVRLAHVKPEELENLRIECLRMFQPNETPDDIREKAAKIKRKYSDIFD